MCIASYTNFKHSSRDNYLLRCSSIDKANLNGSFVEFNVNSSNPPIVAQQNLFHYVGITNL